MTATFHQAHTADLWVGSFAVLIAAASKGRLIAWRIARIEDRAINGHQPHPLIESAFRLWRTEQTTAALQQPSQHLLSQQRSLIRACRGSCHLHLVSRVQQL